jgi:hypothetical protein
MKFLSQFASILLSSLLVLKPLWAQSPPPVAGTELQIHVQDSARIFARAIPQDARGFTIQVTDMTGAGAADAAVVVRLPDDGAMGAFSDGAHSAIVYTDTAGIAHFAPISWNAPSGGVTLKITATKGDAHAGMLLDGSIGSAPASIPATVTPAARVDTEIPATVSKKEPAVVVSPAQPTIAPPQPGAAQSTERALLPSPVVSVAPSEPKVSVINRGVRDKQDRVDTSGSHKKWIILAVVIAAGAGAGIALAGKGKSSSSSSSSSSTGVSIGSPTVSVGTPH